MVLDTYEPDEDMFIFKNTYNDESNGQPKQFKIKRTDPDAPKELFFVHIEVKDMDSLPSQEQRRRDKEAERKKKQLLLSGTHPLIDQNRTSLEEDSEPSENEFEVQSQRSSEESAETNSKRSFFCSLCCCFTH